MNFTNSFNLVDDPLDAFAVHFGGGFFGMVSAPILINNGVILVGDTDSAQVINLLMINLFFSFSLNE